jgi:hypothetical protein
MRVLPAIVLYLCSLTAALPSPPELVDLFIPGPPPGAPTRDQRLAEGWVDDDAKYFRMSIIDQNAHG